MIQFHFHPHFALETLAENKVHLFNRKTQARLATSSPQLISLFSSLSQGETEENLYKNWLEDQGDAIYFYYALDQLRRGNFLSYQLNKGDRCLIRIVPKREWKFSEEAIDLTFPIRLSRFVFFRREGDYWVGESPISPVELWVRDLAVWGFLQRLDQEPQLFSAEERLMMEMLQRAQFLSDADDNPPLATWEFHDLLFHTKSRYGYEGRSFGGTFRFEGSMPPLPAVKPLSPLFWKRGDPSGNMGRHPSP